MDRVHIIKSIFSAIESNNFSTVERFTRPDYRLSGAAPGPMGKEDVLAMLKSLKDGFPDLKFHPSGLVEKADQVLGAIKITGTHSRDLDLAFIGMPLQNGTGTKLKMPVQKITATFTGDRISELRLEPVDGGGLLGLLSQIGVTLAAPV